MPVSIIQKRLNSIPPTTGIYQFFDDKTQLLYVGKAKNLHKRVSSYTKENLLSPRIARMVLLTKKIEIIQTENEVEALLLEHNLIKKFQPKFNILLRDDKTFPQILITNHNFPQITKFRSLRLDNIEAQRTKHEARNLHFGPFASAHDVNYTIDILRKIFRLRNCSDAEFKSRKKPCLEYQIKRCYAPCVGLISQEEYGSEVQNALNFLSGKSARLQHDLTQKMQQFSDNFEYEKAMQIRDQIKALNSIQTKQNINVGETKDFDIITIATSGDMVCVYVSFYRGGQNFGAKPYFFENKDEEILNEFLGQFYLSNAPPSLIMMNRKLLEKKSMEDFITRIAGKKVEIISPKKGAKFELITNQENIARQNLEQKISQNLRTCPESFLTPDFSMFLALF